jgi:hypothetical protein
MRNFLFGLAASLALLPGLVHAADDPPGRVARLSYVEGEVSMAPAGTQEWGEAVLNRPLTSEDRLFVDRGARAELQIGSATVHLDSSTEFAFLDLDDDAMTMRLTEGRATIRILRKREREDIEVSTPNASVALLHPGEYHIEVDQDGDLTVVKARTGEAEVVGEGQTFLVRAGEVGTFRGTAELAANIAKLEPRTAFEDWANERASRAERSAAAQYVDDEVIGREDLDEHGHWVREPEYGYVWYPTYVAAGWAPYRFGRWAWISPWGWTWIDDARWGFAPFHYGRWAYVRNRWCWVPGPRHVRAVYAPALVAWVGGPNVSVSISLGHGVGWFPLAPHEVYVPGYWHTHRYIRRVNVSNTIIVNNVYIDRAYRGRYRDFRYQYRDRPHAVTVVEREHFVRGRPIGGHVARVEDRDLRRWGHDPRPPAIAPVRESVLAGQPRVVRAVSTERSTRPIVARRELPARVSFDDERRAIETNGGRPVARDRLVDSGPKERGDLRVVRGSTERRGSNTVGRSGRAPEVSTARANREATERRRETTDTERSRLDRRDRDTDGQARQSLRSEGAGRAGELPSIERSRGRSSGEASERSRSLRTEPRAAQPQVQEPMRESRGRQWSTPRSTPEAERSPPPAERSPRVERSYTAPERASPPRERTLSTPKESSQPAVRSLQQRESPPARVERSHSQPQTPRVERSQPRVERSPGNSGNSNSGRVSQHSRGSVSRER